MSFGKYQITTLGETFKLQYRHQKFWQIKYERTFSPLLSSIPYLFLLEASSSVFIKCGRLGPNNEEDLNTVVTLQKIFKSLGTLAS